MTFKKFFGFSLKAKEFDIKGDRKNPNTRNQKCFLCWKLRSFSLSILGFRSYSSSALRLQSNSFLLFPFLIGREKKPHSFLCPFLSTSFAYKTNPKPPKFFDENISHQTIRPSPLKRKCGRATRTEKRDRERGGKREQDRRSAGSVHSRGVSTPVASVHRRGLS